MGYINIPDEILELRLNTREILVLAIIYGFSQDGVSAFTGSRAYLAKRVGCCRRTIDNILQRLVQKGLVTKETVTRNGVKICEYRGGAKNCTTGAKIARGVVQNLRPIILDNNTSNNIHNNKGAAPSKFVKPSVSEVAAYCLERGNTVNAQRFVDHYEANGWKVGKVAMKDWQAAVRTWEQSEPARPTPNPSLPRRKKSDYQSMKEQWEATEQRYAASKAGGPADEQ